MSKQKKASSVHIMHSQDKLKLRRTRLSKVCDQKGIFVASTKGHPDGNSDCEKLNRAAVDEKIPLFLTEVANYAISDL